MESRSFQMDTQWNIIYYPEQPTGFGILVIGDERHYVDEGKCFWTQNEGKQTIIKDLKESGYTIFSSNLYGRHWGSENAVELAQRLYHYIIRNEIINHKIHILAEGMGALAALRLMDKMKDHIRSVVLLNPILSLKHHLDQEREHKFFYKKLIRELIAAYQMDQQELEKSITGMEDVIKLDDGCPIKIIHVLSGGRLYNQSKQYHKLIGTANLQPTIILPEKKQQIGKMCVSFYKNHESIL
ncbi:hydrolase [Neobacillus niacini]|uniref:hydrolase n=1 Tax=Neobacillus niacini TaxID=86668 RepID=UPI0021CB7FA8|nr:hydrolase [Neobacillus niacini]MCM3767535.1 hydrolase [Neobacillus niacini]